MKTQATMQAGQLEEFASFLETHPGFYPELKQETAAVCGFRVGGCFLTIGEMDKFISSQPRFDKREAALLLTGRPTTENRKML